MKLVYSGPGKTPEAVAEETAAEAIAIIGERKAVVRTLRFLAVQTSLWTPEQLTKALQRTADRYERQGEPERAA